MKLPYTEGSVFLVPLDNGGFARGVVARATHAGQGILGYFFGPRISSAVAVSWNDLIPVDAIMCIRFGDLGLIDGKWPIVGSVPNWNRSDWPMPDFVRRDPLGRLSPILVRYSDIDPMHIEVEYPIDDDSGLEPDAGWGYGAVEAKLSMLLGDMPQGLPVRSEGKAAPNSANPPSKDGSQYLVDHYLYFPHKQLAENVASLLKKQGFIVEQRLGADEVNWLVLVHAKTQVAPTETAIAEVCEFLERIAEDNGGEYDGWEAEV